SFSWSLAFPLTQTPAMQKNVSNTVADCRTKLIGHCLIIARVVICIRATRTDVNDRTWAQMLLDRRKLCISGRLSRMECQPLRSRRATAWFGIYLFLFALLQSTAAQQEPTQAVA